MLATHLISTTRRSYYNLVAKTTPYTKTRWAFTLALATLYLERAYGMSYSVVSYLIGFYLLQLLVSYVTPKGLDAFEDLEEEHLLVQDELDDKPLVSSMSQFQVWERVSFAFWLGLVCTYLLMVQIDVFWPLLMLYFVILVCYTVHKIMTKMQKYRYSMSDFIKKSPVI